MPQVKIGVLISGSGTNLQSLIDNIENGKINGRITVVISNRKDAYGLNRARQKNIAAVYIRQKDYDSFEKFNDAIIDELKSHGVELVVLAGYLKILTPRFIEEFRNRIINIHPSLIPAFCGKGFYGIKVHEEAINYGVKLSGATVHFVDEKADTGPIIIQEAVEVSYEDTAEALQQKVLKIEHKILPLAVKYYCGGKIQISGRKVKIKE
ncbi:MAG TPA: phosphoribosylglycinamide formyltransferase [Clostridiales bacterium]|jgi:phosphoribosylglycinamide formyltransferase-1|nr:phosphoribosylglycinamide formyltransferase [Clostridiales bacterium]HCS11840.1 phosphoribosylglycinamide formyltransferase [Clostridiales bacterium]